MSKGQGEAGEPSGLSFIERLDLREEGRQEERERVVAWLFRLGASYPDPCLAVHPRRVLEEAARALEKHR